MTASPFYLPKTTAQTRSACEHRTPSPRVAPFLTLDEVRAELGFTSRPSPAERLLVVPLAVTITDKDIESRRRVERRWGSV